jgi:hypothetical protein
VPLVCSSVCSPMPDDLRSPIKHHLVPHWIDPEQGLRRLYSLMIKRDLFGTVRLMRKWAGSAQTGRNWSRCSPMSLTLARCWRQSPGPSGRGIPGSVMPIAWPSKRAPAVPNGRSGPNPVGAKSKVPVKFDVSAMSKAPLWHSDTHGAMFYPAELPHVALSGYGVAGS